MTPHVDEVPWIEGGPYLNTPERLQFKDVRGWHVRSLSLLRPPFAHYGEDVNSHGFPAVQYFGC